MKVLALCLTYNGHLIYVYCFSSSLHIKIIEESILNIQSFCQSACCVAHWIQQQQQQNNDLHYNNNQFFDNTNGNMKILNNSVSFPHIIARHKIPPNFKTHLILYSEFFSKKCRHCTLSSPMYKILKNCFKVKFNKKF